MFTSLEGRMPGVSSERVVTPIKLGLKDPRFFGIVLDGSKSRDPGNSPVTEIRPGILLGKLASNGKYAPFQAGVSQGAVTNPFTSITVTLAQAVEIVRRWGGTSGTLYVNGPATAGGSMQNIAITVSNVNIGTGVITCSSCAAAFIAGSMLSFNKADFASDYHQCLGFLRGFDGCYPIKAVDEDATSRDVSTELVIATDWLMGSELPEWPSNAVIQNWLRGVLNTYGKFHFVEVY